MRSLMFVISTIGLWELVRKAFDIKNCFIPGVTVAAQVTLLFFAGLFNLLPEAVIFLYFLGFFGLGISIAEYHGFGFIKHYHDQSYYFLVIGMILIALSVHGKIFSHYDNFTHWALVVRRMLETNRFPTFMDPIIEFRDYPLGSSVYIYYFCKLTNKSESVQMLAQAYMMIVCMMPLFYYESKDNIAKLLLALGVTNFFFVICIPVTDLLVDTLLALVAAESVAYTILYRKSDSIKQLIPIALYSTQILQIKNSGLFFAATIFLIVLIGAKENANRCWCILSAALPFLTVLLWHKHSDYVFQNVGNATHAMSPGRYKAILRSKNITEVFSILRRLINQSLTMPVILSTAGLIVISGLIVWTLKKEEFREYIERAVLLFVAYICYQIGMFGMYLFSMPRDEALRLAGFDRYVKTFLIFAIYLPQSQILWDD